MNTNTWEGDTISSAVGGGATEACHSLIVCLHSLFLKHCLYSGFFQSDFLATMSQAPKRGSKRREKTMMNRFLQRQTLQPILPVQSSGKKYL